jgi:hypothetical protein
MKLPIQSVSVVRNPSVISVHAGVLPQQLFRAVGGFGSFGGFGRLGLDPLPPQCSECRWTCQVVSCGPNCRREECFDLCRSVPCSIGYSGLQVG